MRHGRLALAAMLGTVLAVQTADARLPGVLGPLVPEPTPPSHPVLVTQPPPPPQPQQPPREGTVRLSNERTLSRWAFVLRRVGALDGPTWRARRIDRLGTITADRTPELVLVLAERRDADGTLWLAVRLPMRPNGRIGWIPRDALGTLHGVTTALEIDLRQLRAVLRRGGRVVWAAPIGAGKAGTPTPVGHFYVRERLVPASTGTIYGSFAFGTSAYSGLTDWPGGGVVGIHGTDQPDLIPGRISHGCIRVRNAAIERLRQLMPLGTPVTITAQR